ncbi:MAG: ribosomal protein S18-alanine N-acetyltransferase [Anaerolineae bacterium]|nr:ribosomal protein S18-alanine N-acetyltransferase [Anaerolineae bacterium]
MTPETYLMRSMRLEDIPQVLHIDQASFPIPWSARTYQFEINSRETSHLVVLETVVPETRQVHGLFTLLQALWKPEPPKIVVGYGGCWLIAGEAHISTIAVHPDYRGHSLGELLLVGMLSRALRLNAEYSVLEVRASNLAAQALYRKYEYEFVGRRRGYYRDNNEDALIMEIRPLDSAYRQRFDTRVAALRERVAYIDRFTRISQ